MARQPAAEERKSTNKKENIGRMTEKSVKRLVLKNVSGQESKGKIELELLLGPGPAENLMRDTLHSNMPSIFFCL